MIKVTCLVVIATAVVYMAMDKLEAILIPFFIALALSYLLTPLIDFFSCKSTPSCPIRLPRGIAVLLSFCCAVAVLLFLGLIILQAVTTFAQRSDAYRERMEQLVGSFFSTAQALNAVFGSALRRGPAASGTLVHGQPGHEQHDAVTEASEMVESFMKDVSLTDLIIKLLGSAAHVAEDLMYIILFLVFMLLHDTSAHSASRSPVSLRVERQIFIYIRGKCSISAFVGLCHAIVLKMVQLHGLWLPFGVVTFFLNFIPNVGGFTAILLPMPLVALDPSFGPTQTSVAFFIPFVVNIFAKDVLEPWLIGQATALQPVAVLLSILIYGSVWGITGMVMAIPLTAVMRIYLSSMDHPLAQFVGTVLSGQTEHKAAAGHVGDEQPEGEAGAEKKKQSAAELL